MAIKIKSHNIFVFIALVVCLIALFIVVFGIFYFSNRGFELSDETFYLYNSNNFNPNIYITQNFGSINKLSCFNYPTLINLRLAKFFYQTLVVLFFLITLFKYLKYKDYFISKTEKMFMLIIGLLASYINYDYLPMTLSYNSWSLIFMLLCFGLVFIEFTNKKTFINIITALLFGFISFCLFLIKFPNFFIAFFIYGFFNIFFIRKNSVIKACFIGLGILSAYFVLINDYSSLMSVFKNYWVSIFEVKHTGGNPYLSQFYNFYLFCIEQKFIIIELVVFLVAILIKKYFSKYKIHLLTSLLIVNFSFSLFFIKGNGDKLYNDFLGVSIFIINTFLFLYVFNETDNRKKSQVESLRKYDELFLIVSLLLMPIGLMIGTNNDFYYTTSQTAIFPIIGVIIFLIIRKTQFHLNFIAFKSILFSFFILGVLYFGAIKKPYRQFDLTCKNYPLNFSKELNGVYESKEKFSDFYSLNILINYFNQAQKPVFVFFNHMGIFYIGNTQIFPESPISDSEHLISTDEYILDRLNFSDNLDLLLLPETVEKSEKFKSMFRKYNVKINSNYKLVYVYQFVSSNEKVYLYKHI